MAFDPDRDLRPITLSLRAAHGAQLREVADRVADAGFALIEAHEPPTPSDLLALARHLGLGEPFLPPIYRRRGSVQVDDSGVAELSAANAVPGAPMHPATSTVGQNWHIDGTLQAMGEIRTSVLLCVRPAATGGDSILFNATGAFVELARSDWAAAVSLMSPGVLIRTATVNDCDERSAGPAFGMVAGHLLTRYARTNVDRWCPRDGDMDTLRRGLDALDALALPGSPFHLRFRLSSAQGLIMANARICHGRTPYTEGPQPRLMLRGLFRADVVGERSSAREAARR
ncbi:TauD/TfdA family dioxygenase [Nonomuraea lactucae]|uniref:TauD/TfdA family dioxygenase n=1 Tax=Nonomuraea lactucae TaxID=2249762 RepID=UPI0013B3EB44|nr:TauD/TfdA family dioxygenase [Nonomuraea lactucae]